MAASLIGGAALGAVLGELLRAVMEIKDKATKFKRALAHLNRTLIPIIPLIKEIERHNDELGRRKDEEEGLQSFIKEMEEGTRLVHMCSKIHRVDYVSRVRYRRKLEALVETLNQFAVLATAQSARDVGEVLLEMRRMRAEYSWPLVTTQDTADISAIMDLSESELEILNDEDEMETDSTEEEEDSESETLQSTPNFVDQVMLDITSLSDIFSKVKIFKEKIKKKYLEKDLKNRIRRKFNDLDQV